MASLEDSHLHLKVIFFAARTFPSNPRPDVDAVLSGVVKCGLSSMWPRQALWVLGHLAIQGKRYWQSWLLAAWSKHGHRMDLFF